MADAAPYHDRDGFIWYDGKLVPWREANLHVLSHALHYASAVFEGERAYGGEIFELSQHSQRLYDGAKTLDFTIPFSVPEIDKACREVVKANKLTDGHGAMLMLPNRDVWNFNAYEDRIEIEESVYLSGTDGPRRAVQLVIYGRARKIPRVHWSFVHVTSSGADGARRRGDEPELPLSAP